MIFQISQFGVKDLFGQELSREDASASGSNIYPSTARAWGGLSDRRNETISLFHVFTNIETKF